jgi:hypothetical protein
MLLRRNVSLCRCIVLFLFFCLSSCGGGTSGTGGVTIDGKVLKPDGSAASEVGVIILESGDSTQTDGNGSFLFENQKRENLTLQFESGDSTAQTRVEGIPTDAKRIGVSCTFDEESSEARTDRVEVKERDDDDRGDSRPDEDSGEDDSKGQRPESEGDSLNDDKEGSSEESSNSGSNDGGEIESETEDADGEDVSSGSGSSGSGSGAGSEDGESVDSENNGSDDSSLSGKGDDEEDSDHSGSGEEEEDSQEIDR